LADPGSHAGASAFGHGSVTGPISRSNATPKLQTISCRAQRLAVALLAITGDEPGDGYPDDGDESGDGCP
jgi:hypothetical protein